MVETVETVEMVETVEKVEKIQEVDKAMDFLSPSSFLLPPLLSPQSIATNRLEAVPLLEIAINLFQGKRQVNPDVHKTQIYIFA